MKKFFLNPVLPIGVAVFSMFFGAGNIIFPLLLGVATKGQISWGFFGLILTAMGGPLLGLTSATLFHGKSKSFFLRAGKYPGWLMLALCLALIGPLAGMPRCVTVAYSAMELLTPNLPVWIFSILFCGVSLLCCLRQNMLLPILGYVLSPMLIASLLLVIYFGVTSPLHIQPNSMTAASAFNLGILTGYDTMDLVASLFFSAGIWNMIAHLHPTNTRQAMVTTLKAGFLGCVLLGIIYFGLSYTAALHSHALLNVPPQKLMYELANLTLGPHIGMVASITIGLACLTTLISLTMTFSNIVCNEIAPERSSYKVVAVTILVMTTGMSLIDFSSLLYMIHTIMTYCYPLIIVLTLYNLAYKLKRQDIKVDRDKMAEAAY